MERNKTLIHCHTDNSIKDSPLKVKDLVSGAKEAGYSSVTLTDHGTCTGLISFMNECKKQGLNGIPGVEAYVKTAYAPHAHLVLLADNYEGYQELCRAISEANENLSSIGGIESPIMDIDILKRNFVSGHVIASSACVSGVLASAFLQNHATKHEIEKLQRKIARYKDKDIEKYPALARKVEEMDAEIAKGMAIKKEVEKVASKSYKKRYKGLLAFERESEEYINAKKQLDEEMAETEKAQEHLAELKRELAYKRHKRSTVNKEKNLLENAYQRSYKTLNDIKQLENSIFSEEELYTHAKEILKQFVEIFGNNFYIELQNHGLDMEKEVMPKLAALANECKVEVILTNDVHIKTAEQAEARRSLKSLRYSKMEPVTDSDRELYIKTEKEIYEAVSQITSSEIAKRGIMNNRSIGDRCHVVIPDNTHYPVYITNDGIPAENSAALLRTKAEEGILVRFAEGEFTQEYKDRMEYELSTIINLGYADYLLIVADFINYAKEACKEHNEHHIGYGCGPGRGSGAGCLVNYLLGITNLDPLKYGLIFERFLNKDRVSMPDIDTDFSEEIRKETIEYVKHKYGEESVALIRTSMTQSAKAAVRNEARNRGFELYGPEPTRTTIQNGGITKEEWNNCMRRIRGIGDRIAGVVPKIPNAKLSDSVDDIKREFNGFSENEDAQIITKRALEVEGTITGTGTHAAGVIIGDGSPLKNFVPLMFNTDQNQWAVQCDMVEAEHDMKLLKMDFLGLQNLDIMTECIRRVYNDTGVEIDLDKIPMEKEVFQNIYSTGNTSSVFQFESAGMKKMLKNFKPESFEDIILLVAAYRPGPIDSIPDIIQVKNGQKKPKYIVPELRDILHSTYGKPIYQEQLMDIFHKCAGFSLGEADIIRRHMSKKHIEEFMSYKGQFVDGIVSMGASVAEADNLWDSLTGFAKYAFNKSHAAAYAWVSYQTAYLKYHYPVEYMCSVLNHAKIEKIPPLLRECKAMGIKVELPDANFADVDFECRGHKICYGIGKIKSANTADAETIVKERKIRKFKSFGDMVYRTELSDTSIKKFISAGVFDSIIKKKQTDTSEEKEYSYFSRDTRESYTADCDKYIDYSKKLKKKKEELEDVSSKLDSLKDISKNKAERQRIIKKIAELSDICKTSEEYLNQLRPAETKSNYEKRLQEEHALLGTYLSGNPLDSYKHIYSQKDISSINSIETGYNSFVGIITDSKICLKKSNGAKMAFFTLEDPTGIAECACFENKFKKYGKLINDNSVVKIFGRKEKIENDDANNEIEEQYRITVTSISVCQKNRPPLMVVTHNAAEKQLVEKRLKKYNDSRGRQVFIYHLEQDANVESYQMFTDSHCRLNDDIFIAPSQTEEEVIQNYKARHSNSSDDVFSELVDSDNEDFDDIDFENTSSSEKKEAPKIIWHTGNPPKNILRLEIHELTEW